ncbi:MAG TPA: hypothetical protein DHW82_00730 [Spirochaetia bacterium]|nr:MAG: hypothetical protein A2Y41_13490 [Spirochaetes bacterium GWB1_36_13]HCL55523.1 hypothetical protein [Spirochaetia bacterium]
MKKKIFISIFLFLFNSTFSAGGDILEENMDWEYFSKNMTCKISSDINYVSKQRYPVFEIQIKYTGNKNISIPWDENFGYVLWDGYFILTSSLGKSKNSSKELKMITSNTYSARKIIPLKKGSVLKTTLDFTKLPASYAVNLFLNGGDVIKFILFIQIKDEKIQIGNSLEISDKR